MQYMIGSGVILTSSKTLKPSLLQVGMKKVQSKVKALECLQPYTIHCSFRRSKAGNSVVSGPVC